MSDERSLNVPKQPLKRVELHLHKFNDVAIPHHVDLLKKHKNNISKFQECSDWDNVNREQINATRCVKQLKALLYEMDMLRNQVQEEEIQKFDKLTLYARQSALDAIKAYLEMSAQRQPSLDILSKQISETDTEVNSNDELTVCQLKLSLKQEDIEKQESCLKSWENLQTEIQDVHELFNEFAKVVDEQRQDIDHIDTNIQSTQENVTQGAKSIQKASKYKLSVYPLAGALLGGCLGGPVGLIAGVKIGGLAALGCGVLGFTGGRFLKKKHECQEFELLNLEESRHMKGSASLPNFHEACVNENLHDEKK